MVDPIKRTVIVVITLLVVIVTVFVLRTNGMFMSPNKTTHKTNNSASTLGNGSSLSAQDDPQQLNNYITERLQAQELLESQETTLVNRHSVEAKEFKHQQSRPKRPTLTNTKKLAASSEVPDLQPRAANKSTLSKEERIKLIAEQTGLSQEEIEKLFIPDNQTNKTDNTE